MGVSGVSIFSDDVAQDVRDAWTHWFKEHGNAAKATEQCRSEMKEEFADADDGPVCVLALALTLWKHGWLDDANKARAMEVIDERSGLKRFAEAGPKVEKARLAEYAKVKAKLNSSQPAKKIVKINLKRAAIPECHLQVGDVFSIPLPAPHVGRGYFRVIGECTLVREKCCVVELLDVPVDSDPEKVSWRNVKSVGIRNYSNRHALNVRFLAVGLAEWKSRKWNRSLLQVHANIALTPDELSIAEKRRYSTGGWEDLPECVIPSLDKSYWPGLKEAYELYLGTSVSEIANLHTCVRSVRDKTGDILVFTSSAACRLMYEFGDYARAEAIMRMAEGVDPVVKDDVFRGHILLGLGKDEEAEQAWEKAQREEESESPLRQRLLRDRIERARKEVAARREGKPLPVPLGLRW